MEHVYLVIREWHQDNGTQVNVQTPRRVLHTPRRMEVAVSTVAMWT